MAYSELIKGFERIRSYMREFYVYGFKSREDLAEKSPRSYDNERRRIESYLGNYMSFKQTSSGKKIYISIDSRSTLHNPLYKALKAKSFTPGDITLHFIIFDILYKPEVIMTLNEIMEALDRDYLSVFSNPLIFDKSTVRKKLKEYSDIGLINMKKEGKKVFYSREEDLKLDLLGDALEYFSETSLCGVIGSYILDKLPEERQIFSFKHHYITHALESEVSYKLLSAISERRNVTINNYLRGGSRIKQWEVVPLKIFVSVQSGRRYLMSYNKSLKEIKAYRLDYIKEVHLGNIEENFMELSQSLEDKQKHMWGASCNNKHLEKVEFTVSVGDNEEHIYRRLEREKRCGTVEWLDDRHLKFSCEVYDSNELVPWIRTFICRLTSVSFSNKMVEESFKRDLEMMYSLYDIGGDSE